MRRRFVLVAIGLTVAFTVAYVGWLVASGALDYAPIVIGEPGTPTPLGVPWRGAVHVHTDLSDDASGTIEEIAAAAARAGLSFVVVADHTGAEGGTAAREGYRRARPIRVGQVYVVVAEEISTDAGHLLALRLPQHSYALGPAARQAIADIDQLSGASMIAHPRGGEAEWRDGFAGVAGMEVISLSSALASATSTDWLRALMAYPVNGEAALLALLRDPTHGIALWDQRTRSDRQPIARPLSGTGAVDAHGPAVLGMPSYEAAFGALSTVVWMDSPPDAAPERERALINDLAERIVGGRSATVISAIGQAPQFHFLADGSGARVGPGEYAPWESAPWTLRAEVGGAATVILLRDAEVVARSETGSLAHDVAEPGTYRVEVRAPNSTPTALPWILSNPIYVWPRADIRRAAVRRAPSLPAPPVATSLLTETGWAAERDDTSFSALAPLSNGLRWEAGLPLGPVRESYAAVAWRPQAARDWRPWRGVAVRLISDETWRVALRLWTDDGNGGLNTWERVVPSAPDARGTGVFWNQFRRVTADGRRLEVEDALGDALEHVAGIALVITPLQMRAGSRGSVEVRTLGLFGAATAPELP